MSKKLKKYWAESASQSVINDYRQGRVKTVHAGKVCRAEQVQETKKSPRKRPSSATKIVEAELVPADLTIPANLKIPAFLDRIQGKTKEQIDKERDALIAKDKARSKKQTAILQGVTSPMPKPDNLTDHDREVIAELKAEEAKKSRARKQEQTERLKALSEKKKADRAEVIAVKQAAKQAQAERNVAAKSEPQKSAKTKVLAKTTPKKLAQSERSKKKADAMAQALQRKNGVDNTELAKVLGGRASAATMRKVCETRGLKFKIVKKDGEATRYFAS